MRFGSKGLDAPTVIGIIIAVVIGVVILFLLWSRGILHFGPAVDKSTCLTQLTDGCRAGSINPYETETGTTVQVQTVNVNKGCLAFSDIQSNCGSCINDGCIAGDADFDKCCKWLTAPVG